MQPYYIFDPIQVQEKLLEYPELASRLVGDKSIFSASFNELKKSQREIYHVLTWAGDDNAGFHFLNLIERGLEKGWIGGQVRAKSYEAFYEAIAELEVMDYFDSQGFAVRPFNPVKGNAGICEMEINNGRSSAHVEVYNPRDWRGKLAFERELRDHLHHLDLPFSYYVTINYHEVNRRDWMNPFAIATAMREEAVRWSHIEPLLTKACSTIQSMTSEEEHKVRYDIPELNLRIDLRICEKRRASERVPRCVTVFNGYSGISEEGMFEDLMQTRIRKKDRKRQTRTARSDQLKILVIHAADLVGWYHLRDQWHRDRVGERIRRVWNIASFHVDMLAFAIHRHSDKMGLQFPIVCSRSPGHIETFFGNDEERVRVDDQPDLDRVNEITLEHYVFQSESKNAF